MSKPPEGWEIKRLDEIADLVMGQSPPGSSYNEVGEGQPFFQGKTEFGEVHPTVRKYTTAGTKFAKVGDILMSVRAPVGPTNIADIDCVIGRGLAAIRAKPVVSQSYLRWSLKHLEIDIQAMGTGTTFDAITGEKLRGTLVALPPISDQQKIVELLEDHLSRLDAALANIKQAKIKATQFRKSLLLSLLNPDVIQNSSDWSRTTLGSVCDLVAGKTPPSLERSIDGVDNSSRSIPFYKVGDMNLDPDYLCKSRLYLSEKQVKDRKLFMLPVGSVVFPKAGGAIATNKKRIVSIPGPIDLNCMAAIPKEETDPQYLSWWFQSINLSTYADGSILPQLSKGKMSEIPVVWPGRKLQEKIVLNLEESLSKNSEAIKLAEAIEVNSSSLRRSLLQSAFTGKLTKEVVNV
jgi:type I restriction enzyme S subunit